MRQSGKVPREFIDALSLLVADFEKNKVHFMSQSYSESQVRIDFIDKLCEALGWSVRLKPGADPEDRDVIVERGPTRGRPDYTFRINRNTLFFLEAKAPHVPLSRPDVILQAKKYAWNNVDEIVYFSALTDFQEFRFYDASRKPDPKHPDSGLIFAHTYDEYTKPEALADLWMLSRASVAQGSLDTLISPKARSARKKSPLDKQFLSDLSIWREKLAKSVHKIHPDLSASDVNNVVQALLDRLIFIRISEDRGILPPNRLRDIARQWREEGGQRPIAAELLPIFAELNTELNGEVFKPHPCELVKWDSSLIVEIIAEELEPYNFAQIGVELLGSIYERYLGKTIRITPSRVFVEDKPEVRKAGGVYYTPKYVVDYIVRNTIGKLVSGKSPAQVARMRFLDPACGSGSFLIGAFEYLLSYNLQWYIKNPKDAASKDQASLFLEEETSTPKLTVEEKARILRNNIYGVDLDPQAVEITMMSLYIKLLEGEKNLPHKKALLPSLSGNIRCGNSLISSDIRDQRELYDEEMNLRYFEWDSKSEGFSQVIKNGGFDAVIGNPPYVQLSMMDYYNKDVSSYIKKHYSSSMGRLNTFGLFIERALTKLVRVGGIVSYIVPNTMLSQEYYADLRRQMLDNTILSITSFRYPVFQDAVVETIVFVMQKAAGARNKILIRDFDNKLFSYSEKSILQSVFSKTHANAIAVNVDERLIDLKTKIESSGRALGNLVNINQAIALKYDRSSCLFKSRKADNYKPVIDGRNIDRYSLTWDGWYLAYNVEKIHSCKRTDIFEASEKIFFRRVGNRLIATLDSQQYYALNTLVIITPKAKSDISLRYILGLLNSKLLNYFYVTYLKSTKKVFSEIQARQLAQVPIKLPGTSASTEAKLRNDIVALVDLLLEMNKRLSATKEHGKKAQLDQEIAVADEKLDRLIYDMYELSPEERSLVEKPLN
jgi:adenine-specific DNA-methyltransferase